MTLPFHSLKAVPPGFRPTRVHPVEEFPYTRDGVRVAEALRIIQNSPRDGAAFDVALVCGFTPLHLGTFLSAHLQRALPDCAVKLSSGLYGDLCGTLERAAGPRGRPPLQGIAVVLEWADLDPRLGYRSAGGWGLAAVGDTLSVAGARLERIAAIIAKIAPEVRITVSLPTLPLPPVFHTAGWQASENEISLEEKISTFSVEISRRRGLALLNSRRLAEDSPVAARFDLKSELLIGFPYTISHADVLAAAHARLLVPLAAKKGIITDLDDTLWSGIVGEAGPEGVSWDLARHHHLHALYQTLLSSLSEQGVLIGAASRNDPRVVEKAFQRSDLLLEPGRVFPIEVHWQAKSGSVARILRTWNVAAESVIFVDDSPMELAEVAAAHPGIHCIRFPTGDYSAGLAMLHQLRDLCGKERILPEDGLRAESIRQGARFDRTAGDGPAPESFLAQADAAIAFDFHPGADDGRVLELVNKTNQFNLNGIRCTEADWRSRSERPGSVVAVLSYRDKFGPLGKIAVVQGYVQESVFYVSTWVMSCRAFARRIEHQCLRTLFDRLGVREMRFEFAPTARNGPLQEFFESLLGQAPGAGRRVPSGRGRAGTLVLSREQFEARRPALYHDVSELRRDDG